MSELLFVYGTLRPGHAPARVAGWVATFIPQGAATVRGRLYDLGAYPGVVLDEEADTVHGELFSLPDDPELLSRLDAYEDYRPREPAESLFLRVRTIATSQDGTSHECWIYVYNRTVPQ